MKKKIISVALVICLIAVAAVGTLAYFTDTDNATNTFTTGKVDITLNEQFDQNSKLLPGKNIPKVINVTNNEETAYVRLHIAFPADTIYYGENGIEEFNNLVHFQQTAASMKAGEWNWSTSAAGTDGDYLGADYPGYPGNHGDFNTYTTVIDNTEYRVFVVTYMTALEKGEKTNTDALLRVYLDKYADTNDGVTYTAPAGVDYRTEAMTSNLNNYKIYVAAEGTQAEGFNDAYAALNTAFGVPGAYTVNWTAVAGA